MRPFPIHLDIIGEVQALFRDQTILLRASHDVITIEFPNLRAGMAALRVSGGRVQRTKWIGRVSAALHATSLNVDLQIASTTVAHLGTDARPGLMSHLLGVGEVEIRPAGLVSSLVRSFSRALRRS